MCRGRPRAAAARGSARLSGPRGASLAQSRAHGRHRRARRGDVGAVIGDEMSIDKRELRAAAGRPLGPTRRPPPSRRTQAAEAASGPRARASTPGVRAGIREARAGDATARFAGIARESDARARAWPHARASAPPQARSRRERGRGATVDRRRRAPRRTPQSSERRADSPRDGAEARVGSATPRWPRRSTWSATRDPRRSASPRARRGRATLQERAVGRRPARTRRGARARAASEPRRRRRAEAAEVLRRADALARRARSDAGVDRRRESERARCSSRAADAAPPAMRLRPPTAFGGARQASALPGAAPAARTRSAQLPCPGGARVPPSSMPRDRLRARRRRLVGPLRGAALGRLRRARDPPPPPARRRGCSRRRARRAARRRRRGRPRRRRMLPRSGGSRSRSRLARAVRRRSRRRCSTARCAPRRHGERRGAAGEGRLAEYNAATGFRRSAVQATATPRTSRCASSPSMLVRDDGSSMLELKDGESKLVRERRRRGDGGGLGRSKAGWPT